MRAVADWGSQERVGVLRANSVGPRNRGTAEARRQPSLREKVGCCKSSNSRQDVKGSWDYGLQRALKET